MPSRYAVAPRYWPTTDITDVAQAEDELAKLAGRRWLCRGQDKIYGALTPSIDRDKLRSTNGGFERAVLCRASSGPARLEQGEQLMAKQRQSINEDSATLGYEAQLWQMADALRGSMDAAEYIALLFHSTSDTPPGERAVANEHLVFPCGRNPVPKAAAYANPS